MSSLNPNYRITILQSSPKGTNTAGQHILVEAPMPESFMFDTQSAYAPMLPQGLTGGNVATALAAFGIRLAVPALTAQLWQGSSEIMLQLAMEFHTESDPVADVQTPIMNLNRLTLPSISPSSDMLQSPGPVIAFDQLSNIASNAKTELGNIAASALGTKGALIPRPTLMSDSSLGAHQGATTTQKSNTQNPNLGSSQYWKTQIENQISIRIGNYLYFDSVVITNVQQTFMSNIDAITGLPHHATVNVTFKPLFMLTVEDLVQVFTSNSAPGQSAGPNTLTQNSLGSSYPQLR